MSLLFKSQRREFDKAPRIECSKKGVAIERSYKFDELQGVQLRRNNRKVMRKLLGFRYRQGRELHIVEAHK